MSAVRGRAQQSGMAAWLVLAVAAAVPLSTAAAPRPQPAFDARARIDSLARLSIESLRRRRFTARFTLESTLGDERGSSAYAQFYGPPFYRTVMASYRSDGLRVYARVDQPPAEIPRPAKGWPVIVFAHGWVGAEHASAFDFDYSAGSYYGDLIDRYVKAGFIVVMPGFRGHGSVRGVPAQGIEFIRAYDNGSYLSPVFYAVDLLHALQAVDSIAGLRGAGTAGVDRQRIYLTGHSQGGDAAFTALAVSSSPAMRLHFAAASIWAGCIAGRMEQGAFYGPMEGSADAAADPAYFPYRPPGWDDRRHSATIREAIEGRRIEMYATARAYVAGQARADLRTDSLRGAMAAIDAVRFPQYIGVPLDLHYSDHDYYSIPAWNAAIVRAVRGAGGMANAFLYPGNSHDFRIVAGWSPPDAAPGRETALKRTLALFGRQGLGQ